MSSIELFRVAEKVHRRPSPKLGAYAGLVALGLLSALVLERPELVALSAPFAFLLAAGLALASRPSLRLDLTLDHERTIEGEVVQARIDIDTDDPIERVELFLALPDGLSLAEGDNPVSFRLPRDGERELELVLRCDRWGAYVPGEVHVRAHDLFGLLRYETRFDRRRPLKVFPREETLRELLRPVETQVFAGNQVARQKAEGIEFADIRPFAPGDRIRRVNWRASARRGDLWVNEYHAERNADVIIFLDSFTEARRHDVSTLDLAVRAAAALAGRYLRQKDRVGLVNFGGVLNWLLPATGLVPFYRMVDSLLDTEITLNYAWKDLDVIPRRTLPAKALVIALTPLLDDRASKALLDLRARGFDLVVVDISPVPFVEPGPSELDRLAYRLWLLRREALRGEYERVGVPVAVWDEGTPLVAALEQVQSFRRHAREAHA